MRQRLFQGRFAVLSYLVVPVLALTLGIFTAALGSVMSFLRLAAR